MPTKIKNIKGVPHNSDMVLPLMLTGMRDDGSPIWYCLCKCGRLLYRSHRRLRDIKVKSCGCLKSKKDPDHGFKRNRWTYLYTIVKDKKIYYGCQCDCGTIKEILKGNFWHNKSKSCGCILKEMYKQKSDYYTFLRVKKKLGMI